jgi:hypothetical protein
MLTLVASTQVSAENLNAHAARKFVLGKLFAFTCFDGSRGAGRVYSDGSVVGTIQFRGSGQILPASLPAGTLQVKGDSVCASLKNIPVEPCFELNRTSNESFRGSLLGLSGMYCDFTRRPRRTPATPLSLEPARWSRVAPENSEFISKPNYAGR